VTGVTQAGRTDRIRKSNRGFRRHFEVNAPDSKEMARRTQSRQGSTIFRSRSTTAGGAA
jgi:hypothetical protein